MIMNNITPLTHKQRKQQEQDNRKSVKDMLTCPYCHAQGWPLALRDPQTEEEKEAVFCPSCHKDVMPFMRAYIKAKEETDKEVEQEIAEGKWDKTTEDVSSTPMVSHIDESQAEAILKPKRKSSPRKKKVVEDLA